MSCVGFVYLGIIYSKWVFMMFKMYAVIDDRVTEYMRGKEQTDVDTV